ncbi:MAG: hypothetical protein C4538_04690 [Nitrospiraceae bacterium]|nr:MAG: hypothetical protein C4538_04690 [Nitrospiraceae bacterium]
MRTSAAIIMLAVVFCGLFVTGSKADEGTVSVRYPPDRTVIDSSVLGVSLNVIQGSTDLIKIQVNAIDRARIFPDSNFECFAVPISFGLNNIRITASRENANIGEIVFTVFRRSSLESRYKNPPPDFQKNYFHMSEHPECSSCHVLVPGDSDKKPVNIAAFPDESPRVSSKASETSTCFSCHKSLTLYPFVHGPAAVWSCLSCHEFQAKPVYSVKKPDTKLCFICHVQEQEEWYSKKYFHGPFNIEGCAICHDPHASGTPFNLVKPVWDLCVGCHSDKQSGEHIVAGFSDIHQHPTRGKPDPLRKGMELSCASCHEPHASNSPKLWRLDAGSGLTLCKKCHTE